MKIVIIGGTGLIGRQVAQKLTAAGHDIVAASPSTGIDAVSGAGLAGALAGADVVVDVANSPSFEDAAVLDFFQKSSSNLLAAEAAAGVRHHLALSVVGTERLLASGYFRAKMAQEELIKASPIPYTLLRATQFFEFVGAIAGSYARGNALHAPSSLIQPVAAAEVAEVMAGLAAAAPLNGTVELAGPEALPLDVLLQSYLHASNDPRAVITDPAATYFGTPIDDASLTPGAAPRIGTQRFADWLQQAV